MGVALARLNTGGSPNKALRRRHRRDLKLQFPFRWFESPTWRPAGSPVGGPDSTRSGRSSILPRSAGEGDRAKRGGRGQRRAEPPPPPCCAGSPSPAMRGRRLATNQHPHSAHLSRCWAGAKCLGVAASRGCRFHCRQLQRRHPGASHRQSDDPGAVFAAVVLSRTRRYAHSVAAPCLARADCRAKFSARGLQAKMRCGRLTQ